MRKALLLSTSLFFVLIFSAKAQVPNFSENVAPIMYAKCASCHHTGAIAPDPLITYDDVSGLGTTLMQYVDDRIMPPWPPDPKYSSFAHERLLTTEEVQTIDNWVLNGVPRGDSTLAPAVPVFNDGPQIPNPDLTQRIPTYTVQSSQDEYRCFVIPSGLSQSRFLQSMEIVPGNHAIVHHVLVFYDTTGQCLANDQADPLPGYSCFGGTGCNSASLIGLWAPGAPPQTYPQGMGISLPANGYFILQVHYAPGSQGQADSTRINIKLTPNNFVRPVYIAAPLNHYILTNGPLVIPANTEKTFYCKYTLPATLSVLSVGPHMHLIGTSIKVYCFDPSAPTDTIPLINIPNWDFRWQGAYFFPKVMKLNSGTVLKSEAFYNNTSSNPNNPNDPIKTVTLGENTTNEMMLVYFAYTPYFPGDENIVQDSASIATGTNNIPAPVANIWLYPNPSSGEVNMYLKITEPTQASLRLIDISGRVVKEIWQHQDISQPASVYPLSLDNLTTGLYLLDYESKGQHVYTKVSIAE